jgi:hypothetical protein
MGHPMQAARPAFRRNKEIETSSIRHKTCRMLRLGIVPSQCAFVPRSPDEGTTMPKILVIEDDPSGLLRGSSLDAF